MPIVTGPFVTMIFNLSRSSKVKPVVILAFLDIFHVKKYDVDFLLLKVVQGQI